MKSNLVYSCYFSKECCQSSLPPVSRNPHTSLAFRAHSQITVPALAFTSKPGKPIEVERPGGVLSNIRLMRITPGWGHIFPTGLTIMGCSFNRVTRMGSHISGILGIRKFRLVGFKLEDFYCIYS